MFNTTLYEGERVSKFPKSSWLVAHKGAVEQNLREKKRDRYIPNINQYQGQRARVQIVSCIINIEPLPQRFKRLLSEWKMQAAPLPSATAMAMLPSYQEIIGMGEPALPLILNELKERPAHLFWALRAISGVDPVAPENRGRIDKMIEAWINWGRQKRIIE